MTGAPVAAALLLATLALALGFAPARRAAWSVALAVVLALAAVMIGTVDRPIAFAGCWVSLIVTAAAVYWPRPWQRWRWGYHLLAANAGLWSGLVIAAELPARLPLALAALILIVPAAWCVQRGWTIPPKVVASWLLAVALLAGSIPYLVDHPGYVPDHRE